jgi:uncharacterized protein with HEPN domain
LKKDEQLIYNACQALLVVIGEETNKIESELLNEHPHIPWKNIKKLRNRIAHDYRGLDPTISYSVIRRQLNPLKDSLIKMLEKIDYPVKKLNTILDSEYYSHIGYLRK